ncbi:snake venom metalloproteinase VMP1 [Amia ocellicauda]|uniref:snake venom metalloproteinase VMP1 n=1 Tax=Amia ocellicauda TaxID=2972642 RepID=UPI003464C0B3
MKANVFLAVLASVAFCLTVNGCRRARSVDTKKVEVKTIQIYSSNSEEEFPKQAQLSMQLSGQNHTVHLVKTLDLLSERFTLHHYTQEGSPVSETRNHMEHCCYIGWMEGFPDSYVALCTCQGFSGFLSLGEHSYTITPAMDGGPQHTLTKFKAPERKKRSASLSPLPTTGHPQPSTVPDKTWGIELFLVADHAEFQRQNSDVERTQWKLITLAHHLKQIYKQVGIEVWLVGTEVWTEGDKAEVSYSSSDALTNFLKWRQTDLLQRVHHDNAQLISGKRFEGKVLGEAPIGTMCSPISSGGLVQSPDHSAWELAEILAHEIGHNLGMYHDNEPGRKCSCTSWSGKCILNSFTGPGQSSVFSDCSKNSLAFFLKRKNATCLKDKPHTSLETDDLTKVYRLPLLVWALSLLLLGAVFLCVTLLLRKWCNPLSSSSMSTSSDALLKQDKTEACSSPHADSPPPV